MINEGLLVSVITVCRNAAQTIEGTIRSVLEQSFVNYEYIIIDGASTDGTLSIVTRYADRISLIVSEPDDGIFSAQNKGIRAARGQYLFFLNSGDRFYDRFVLKTFQAQAGNADIVYFDVMNDWGQANEEWGQAGLQARHFPDQIDVEYWFKDYLCHQAVFARCELFSKYGSFNESYRYVADHDFFYRVWKSHGFKSKHVSSYSVIYNMEGVSVSREHRPMVLREFRSIKIKNFGIGKFLRLSGRSHDTRNWLFTTLGLLWQMAGIARRALRKAILIVLSPFRLMRWFVQYQGNRNRIRKSNTGKGFKATKERLRVLVVNTHDGLGGAARAVRRQYEALRNQDNLELLLLVSCSDSSEAPDVILAEPLPIFDYIIQSVLSGRRRRQIHQKEKYFTFSTGTLHSASYFDQLDIPRQIKRLKPDIVHLHWLQDGCLSVEQIGEIQGPIVWTLHDMWPLCGAEHYSDIERYIEGYSSANCPADQSANDLNQWVWQRKMDRWDRLRRSANIVGVSEWIAGCARKSALFNSAAVLKIHNCLDTSVFRPGDKRALRLKHGLPVDASIVLSGALGYECDKRKGYDDMEALRELLPEVSGEIILVSFGGSRFLSNTIQGLRIREYAMIQDDNFLAELYALSDVFVTASRMETFGQTVAESMACGTPVVAYRTTGIIDLVDHKVNGFLAPMLHVEGLFEGVQYVLADGQRNRRLSENAREKAVEFFSYSKVAQQLAGLYEQAAALEDGRTAGGHIFASGSRRTISL